MIPPSLVAAEARLSATYDALTDELASGPSLLPGWTRAVLVRHIAVNARTNAQMIEAALHGERRPQYAYDGEREELIEWGRGRPAVEVVADARAAADEFASAISRATDWDVLVDAGVGAVTIAQRVRGREFEVEVHHGDLDLGYRYADWPAEFVAWKLPDTVAALPRRLASLHPGAWGITVENGGPAWTLLVPPAGAPTPASSAKRGPNPAAAVVAAEPVVAVREGADDVRGLVTGPAWALLAWLIGRDDGDALKVTGDQAVADLPSWFPYG